MACAKYRAEGASEITPAQSVDIASDDRVSLRVLEVRIVARSVSDKFRPDFRDAVQTAIDSDFTLALNPTSNMLGCEENDLWLQHLARGCGNTEMVYAPPRSTLRHESWGCGAGAEQAAALEKAGAGK
jgi:hypothetical protein